MLKLPDNAGRWISGNFSKGFHMRHQPTPAQSAASVSTDLFRNRLDAQIDLRHSLCKLSAVMPWAAALTVLVQTKKQLSRPTNLRSG